MFSHSFDIIHWSSLSYRRLVKSRDDDNVQQAKEHRSGRDLKREHPKHAGPVPDGFALFVRDSLRL